MKRLKNKKITYIIGLVLIIFALACNRAPKEYRDMTTCITNLRSIQTAKSNWYAQWTIENNTPFPDDMVITWDHLIPKYLDKKPICPSKGT